MSQMGMERPAQKLWAVVLCIAAPVIAFYSILFRYVVNIPTLDDYDSALELVTRLSILPSFHDRLIAVLSSQHNEYRVVVASAVFWLQYSVSGKINFTLSSVIGDLVPSALALLLWRMFLRRLPSTELRLALFVPVVMLIFQLNYAEALNAPMTALQHLPALVFAFASIIFLLQPSGTAFGCAVLCLLASIFASTNGFLVLPVGLLLLVQRKLWRRAEGWSFVGVIAILLYRHGYAASTASVPSWQHSSLATLLLWKPIYFLGVVGAAAAPFGAIATYLLGIGLSATLLFLAWRGYFQRNPAIGYCTLFLLLTALGIAHIRTQFGMEYSGSSRYRMYSDLLLVFVWFAIADEGLLHRGDKLHLPLWRNWMYVSVLLLAACNALGADWQGRGFLRGRYQLWISGISEYEHPDFPGDTSGPLHNIASEVPRPHSVYDYTRQVFADAIAHGVYTPPYYPARLPSR